MAAARLWALLRLLGHLRVAVLDGGLRRWQALGLPLTDRVDKPQPVQYSAVFDQAVVLRSAQVLARLGEQPPWLLDARAAARFRGEVVPIDAVAGHVPGVINRPYRQEERRDGNGWVSTCSSRWMQEN